MIKLETDKLILRMFTPDDLDALDYIFSKPSVMKYLGLHGEPMSRDETETALLSMIKHWERYGYGRLAVISKNDQKLIGARDFVVLMVLLNWFFLLMSIIGEKD